MREFAAYVVYVGAVFAAEVSRRHGKLVFLSSEFMLQMSPATLAFLSLAFPQLNLQILSEPSVRSRSVVTHQSVHIRNAGN